MRKKENLTKLRFDVSVGQLEGRKINIKLKRQKKNIEPLFEPHIWLCLKKYNGYEMKHLTNDFLKNWA